MGNKLLLKECPDCGMAVHDCWTKGRKLQQRCDMCGWGGEPRVPETIAIKDTKNIRVGQFYGFHYEIFDKYGHISTISSYYQTEEEAVKEMKDSLARRNKQPDLAPCTAVLWPNVVAIKGEVFK